MEVQAFTFNVFSENTYLLIGSDKDCLLIDPGMNSDEEMTVLTSFIESNDLNISRLLLTHAHIDHVLGNKRVFEKWGLKPECHRDCLPTFDLSIVASQMYGVPYTPGPDPENFLSETDMIDFDGQQLEIRLVPGHAPGHLVFIDHVGKNVIAGDTLFNGSIGRTDLPGGDHELLLSKIQSELYSLEDEYKVHPGHGLYTTIGHEKVNNPFVTYQG
jgi:glyoxylase-like metal-dependent hydrolase (beta-lactamase superfamily II)